MMNHRCQLVCKPHINKVENIENERCNICFRRLSLFIPFDDCKKKKKRFFVEIRLKIRDCSERRIYGIYSILQSRIL